MNKKLAIAAISFATFFISGCGGGDSSEPTVIINETKNLGEGFYMIYPLPTGSYKAEVAASNNGVIIEWIGGVSCINYSNEVKSYNNSCTLSQAGQFKITNPTLLGLGGDELITIKVTKND